MPGSSSPSSWGSAATRLAPVLRHPERRDRRASARDRARIRRAFFREPHRDEHDADVSGASTSYMAPVARAVLIDMEPKVVQSSLRRARKTGRWQYDGDRTLAFQSGSGNNWARGYHTYGDAVRHDVLDLVAKEAEACDHMGGFVLMQSMAGAPAPGWARTWRMCYATSTPRRR